MKVCNRFWNNTFFNFLLEVSKKFSLIWEMKISIWTNNWDVETYRNKLENECTLVCLKQTLRCTAPQSPQLYVPTFTLCNGGLFDFVWLRMKLRAWISMKFLYILLRYTLISMKFLYILLGYTLRCTMFGVGQKVLSCLYTCLAWSKFWPILANQETLTDFHGNEAKKKYFFWKMADSRFSKPPILEIFSRKFHGFGLWIVVFIDAKGINVAQLIWSWNCPG